MFNLYQKRECLDILQFTVYKPLPTGLGWQTESHNTYNYISDLPDIMLQPNQRKERRNLIIFNETRGGTKTRESFYLPNTVMLDVDFKKKPQREKIITDLNLSCDVDDDTILTSLSEIITNIPFCYYFDYSSSNKGIKALFCVVSEYYALNNDQINGADLLHRINYNGLINYLSSETPLKFHGDKEGDYIDSSASSITQGTYTSNGNGLFINNDYCALLMDVDDNQLNKHIQHKQKHNHSDSEHVKNSNDLFTVRMMDELAKDKVNHPINLLLKNRFEAHYNEILPFLFSLKGLNSSSLKIWWKIISFYYKGDALKKHLKRFDRFEKYINNLKTEYSIPLNILLPEISTHITAKDVFQNIFDNEIVINQYLKEKESEIETIIRNNNTIVIKAPTGTGKTTLVLDIIERELLTGENKKIILCIPKNSLLEQLKYKIKTERQSINISISYGNGVYYKPIDGLNELILTSTPKLMDCINYNPYMIVIDEIHNLTTQSHEINTFFKCDCKTVLISATPEPYLIGEKGYYYLNIIKNKAIKRPLNIIKSKRPIDTMRSLIKSNKKQLFVVNDKCVGKRINEEYPFVRLMNRDEYDKDVVNNEMLNNDHYICTTFISDGLNFNNLEWDDIIIVDNINISFFDIYQISNRFRKVDNINITLITGFNREGEKTREDINFKWFNAYGSMKKDKELIFNGLNINEETHNYLKSKYFHEKHSGNYFFNPFACKFDLLNMVINWSYYLNNDVFEYFIGQYFTINYIEMGDIKESFKNKQSNFKDFIIKHVEDVDIICGFGGDLSMVNLMIDVEALDCNVKKMKAVINQLSNYTDEYQTMLKRYKEVRERGFKVDYGVLSGDSKQYKKWLTNQQNQIIFNLDEKNVKDIDWYLWRCQHLINEYMKNNSFEQGKYINVIKCKDVFKWVETLNDDVIKDIDGRFFFNKNNEKSVGLFIKRMGVKRVQIKVNNIRERYYQI